MNSMSWITSESDDNAALERQEQIFVAVSLLCSNR